MKRIPLVTSILSVALLAGCGSSTPRPAAATPASGTAPAPAAAQAPGATPVAAASEDGDGAPGFDRMLARFDANKDGKLQVTELPPRMQQMMGDADADKDGVLTADELKAFGAAMAKKMFDRMDADHDGSVTQAEAGRAWQRIQVADADGDGKITWDEMQKAHESGKLAPRGGPGGRRGGHGRRHPGPPVDENGN